DSAASRPTAEATSPTTRARTGTRTTWSCLLKASRRPQTTRPGRRVRFRGSLSRYGGRVEAYFDAAAAARLHPVPREALLAALADGWADPGKLYARARRARQLLDAARASMAENLGVRPDELHFCDSGTQAAELAVHGGLAGRARVGPTFVHSAVEHSSVLYAAPPGAVSVPVDRLGRLDLDAFAAAVRAPGVALAA